RFHVERIENFSQSGGRGSQSTSFGPSGWGKASPNSTEERVIAAVCGPTAAPAAAQPTSAPPAAPPAAPVIPDVKPLPVVPATRPAPPPEPAPRPVKSGSVRVQLFAGDRQTAQHFVDGLPGRLPSAAGVGKPEIVQASSGGHVVYRVQLPGFA